jgi:hypothetical protein
MLRLRRQSGTLPASRPAPAVGAPRLAAGQGRPAPTGPVAGAACADAPQNTRLYGHAARFVSAAAGCSRSIAAWCASRDAP